MLVGHPTCQCLAGNDSFSRTRPTQLSLTRPGLGEARADVKHLWSDLLATRETRGSDQLTRWPGESRTTTGIEQDNISDQATLHSHAKERSEWGVSGSQISDLLPNLV